MSLKSIAVKYSADVGSLIRDLDKAAAANVKLAAASEKAGKKIDGSAKASTRAGQQIGAANDKAAASTDRLGASSERSAKRINMLAGVGVGVALALGGAISKFAEFDATMSQAAAASGATADELSSLRTAAISAGKDTKYSATEAAQGITELAKAGVSTADILGGGLTGALSLASAGQIGVADAAEISATALTQFNLKGSQVSHVADLLAAGANKAQGGVGDLGAALKQSGLVAAQTGLSIEETTAGLTAFASAGLIGSDAGTSFKSMLQRLTPQSKQAKAAMEELGISAYDSQGQFIGLEKFAGNLRSSLQDLTPEQRNSALATIFGSDAVRAASIIYNQGATGIHKWTDEVNQQGYAAKQAAQLTDNLQGDIERLGGSIETAFISSGSGANDALRTLVQTGGALVDIIGQIPGPVLTGAAALTTLALVGPKLNQLSRTLTGPLSSGMARFRQELALQKALGGGITGGYQRLGDEALTAGTKVSRAGSLIGAARASVGGFKGALSGLAGAFNPLTIGITAAVAGLAAYGQAQANAEAAAKSLLETIDKTNGAFTQASTNNIREALMGDLSTSDQTLLSGIGVSLGEAADQALKGGPAFDQFRAKLVAMKDASLGQAGRWTEQTYALDGLISSLGNQGEVIDDTRARQALATDEARRAAVAQSEGAGSASAAEGATSDLAKATTDLERAQKAGADASSSLTTLIEKLGAKGEDAKKRLDALSQAIDLLGGGSRALQAATDAAAASIDGVAEAADKARAATKKKTSEDYTSAEKARDVAAANRTYRAALRDVATSSYDLIKVQKDQNASAGTLNGTYQAGRKVIEDRLRLSGLHGKALQAETDKIIGTKADFALLLAEYKKNPGKVDTKVAAPGAVKATGEVRVFTGIVNGVPQFKTVTVKANTATATAAIGNFNKAIGDIVKNVTVNVKSIFGFTGGTGGGQGGEMPNRPGGGGGFSPPVSNPVGTGFGGYPGHKGVDFLSPIGTPVYAPIGGTVIRDGWDTGGFGTHVRTRDDDGRYTILGHLSSEQVSVGQRLTKGQFIGRTGSTGNSTGPHIHVERRTSEFGGAYNWIGGGTSSRERYRSGARYAAGGFNMAGDVANGHTPAIYQASNVVRAFAEPETKGEAYVPLANDWRRPRAKSIMAQTANMLGGTVQWHAAGGINGGTPVPLDAFYAAAIDRLGDKITKAILTSNAKAVAAAKTPAALKAAKATQSANLARYAAQSQSPLTKFGNGLTTGVRNSSTFIRNIETIASRGYVTLAQQLAAMSNEDAERIASEAARASTKTLSSLQGQVNTQVTNEQKLGSINAISAILGSVRSRNLNVRQLSDSTGIGTTELLDAAKLIKSQLTGNKNASRLLLDLANYGKGQTVFDAIGPSASDLRSVAAKPIASRVGVSTADVARTQLTFARLEATLTKLAAARPPGPAGPLVRIDKVTTVDVDAAAKALTTRLGDALAVTDRYVGG